MTAGKDTFSHSYEDRIQRRFGRTATAVANRIRSLMGEMTQTDLADRVGKGDSTVSDHLSGTVNVTLRTIAEYETALDETIVKVPDVDRPTHRRRRSLDTRSVSKEQQAVRDIDPVKRRLHRLLTRISARIGQVLNARDERTQQALAERIGKDPSYVSRVLGGGVNLTLKTIAQFEVALNTCLLQVEGLHSRGLFQGRREQSDYVPFRKSSDGRHFQDHSGRTSSGLTGWLESKNQECLSEEPEMVAA